MDIFAPRTITLVKPRFDDLHIMRLNEACDEESHSKLAVMTMEDGLANLYIITNRTSIFKGEVKKSIAKNKGYHQQSAKS